MPKSSVLSPFKKTNRRFQSFYADWFRTLDTTLLTRLTDSLSSPSSSPADLVTASEAVHRHFRCYYAALDLAAQPDYIPVLLDPPWRNSLEKPFLFLGDLHPYLFTNLLRSFLESNDDEDEYSYLFDYEIGSVEGIAGNGDFLEKQWHVATAWSSPSKLLMPRIDDIERGLRLMVPALSRRVLDAQTKFVRSIAADGAAQAAAAAKQMEELVSVFRDANRLRWSTIAEIVGATTMYQAALFLQALARFVVGLGNLELLQNVDQCNVAV